MAEQYSESPRPIVTLALDGASPRTSVAIARGAEILGERQDVTGRSSRSLLAMIDEILKECGLRINDVDRLIGTRGPGSFTGLRVGLATLLGLHQCLALDVSASTAVTTLEALARQAWRLDPGRGPILAVVDALRGEWFAQIFTAQRDGARPGGPAGIRSPGELFELDPRCLVGFGVGALGPWCDRAAGPCDPVEAKPLAATLLELAHDDALEWNAANLVAPLYLRPPAAKA